MTNADRSALRSTILDLQVGNAVTVTLVSGKVRKGVIVERGDFADRYMEGPRGGVVRIDGGDSLDYAAFAVFGGKAHDIASVEVGEVVG